MRLIHSGRRCASAVSPCRHGGGEPEAVCDAEARRRLGHLCSVSYLAPRNAPRATCASALLEQRHEFMHRLFKQPVAGATGGDAAVRQAACECVQTRMPLCTTSPEPWTSAPWLPRHPRPPAPREWPAPLRLGTPQRRFRRGWRGQRGRAARCAGAPWCAFASPVEMALSSAPSKGQRTRCLGRRTRLSRVSQQRLRNKTASY
jgi:hypothetical protein